MGRKLTLNEYLKVLSDRMSFIEERSRTGRDVNKECGYPSTLLPMDYWWMYDREQLAAKCVNAYPEESWAVDPEIYETERVKNTPFEEDWNELLENPQNNPLPYLLRADCLSGVGRYAVIFTGLDDDMDPSTKAEGIEETGLPSETRRKRKVNFFRVFDETTATIAETETNIRSPRFMRPKFYDLTVLDADITGRAMKSSTMRVHWSRVHHVADTFHTPTKSEIFAVPRLQGVYNRLLDIRKILGGSAEMFWKGGFPGIALTADPRFLEAGGEEIDQETIDEQMQPYMEGLQRYISFVGTNVTSLSPQVADPTAHVAVQMQYIATSLGIPLRVLMGSEQGKLAGGQDGKNWNRKLKRRQTKYITPGLLKPFADRMVMLGVLRPTRKWTNYGTPSYKVNWPDIDMPNEDELSTIADRSAASIQKYMACQGWQLIQPSDFIRLILGRSADETKVIMENIKKTPEIEFTPVATAGGGDTGVKGKPPSDPKPAVA